jgi:very-short-patch-repair endonuclease
MNRVRLLRKKATDTEHILWRHLRNRNFAGYKSRRQHPFNCYILDFYCPAAKLAIELDGGGHNYRLGQIRDRTRSEFLARQAITVLPFWNHQVRQELDSVLKSNLVCAAAAMFVATLTSIRSLCQRERRNLES